MGSSFTERKATGREQRRAEKTNRKKWKKNRKSRVLKTKRTTRK